MIAGQDVYSLKNINLPLDSPTPLSLAKSDTTSS